MVNNQGGITMSITNEILKNGEIRGTSMGKSSAKDPYMTLIAAVVGFAAKDIKEDNAHADSAKDFFKSQWFNDLTNLDGERILERMQEEMHAEEKIA